MPIDRKYRPLYNMLPAYWNSYFPTIHMLNRYVCKEIIFVLNYVI